MPQQALKYRNAIEMEAQTGLSMARQQKQPRYQQQSQSPSIRTCRKPPSTLAKYCASSARCPGGTARRADARSSCSIWFRVRRGRRPSSATYRDEPCHESSASAFASGFLALRLPPPCTLRAGYGMAFDFLAQVRPTMFAPSPSIAGWIARRAFSGRRPLNAEWDLDKPIVERWTSSAQGWAI